MTGRRLAQAVVAWGVLAAGPLTGCANGPMSADRSPPHTSTPSAPSTPFVPADSPREDAPPFEAGGPVATELDPAADLYATPPEAPGRAGTLVRYQRVVGDAGPGNLWRVVYASTDDDGRPIPVTGTVRVPDGGAPGAGWPTVTWAHGTTGSADVCAPSRTLQGGPADALAADGIVVASTDYAGLGTPGLHPYLDGASEGRAVLDIVTAAASLPEVRLDGEVAVWGHSQGGHAALFARQMASERLPDGRIVGTVAIAPPSQITVAMTVILQSMQPKTFAALALAGIAATEPGADLRSVLTPQAAGIVEAVADQGCADDVGRMVRAFGGDPVLVARPDATEPWATRLAADEPAVAPGTGPLLLIHAADDATVPAAMSATVKERTCARDEPTQRWLAPSGGHSGIVGDTWAAARQWTLDRFDGAPTPDGCGASDEAPPAA